MSRNGLDASLYQDLTLDERFKLGVAAASRDDHEELGLLQSLASLRTVTVPDPAYILRVTNFQLVAQHIGLHLLASIGDFWQAIALTQFDQRANVEPIVARLHAISGAWADFCAHLEIDPMRITESHYAAARKLLMTAGPETDIPLRNQWREALRAQWSHVTSQADALSGSAIQPPVETFLAILAATSNDHCTGTVKHSNEH